MQNMKPDFQIIAINWHKMKVTKGKVIKIGYVWKSASVIYIKIGYIHVYIKVLVFKSGNWKLKLARPVEWSPSAAWPARASFVCCRAKGSTSGWGAQSRCGLVCRAGWGARDHCHLKRQFGYRRGCGPRTRQSPARSDSGVLCTPRRSLWACAARGSSRLSDPHAPVWEPSSPGEKHNENTVYASLCKNVKKQLLTKQSNRFNFREFVQTLLADLPTVQ